MKWTGLILFTTFIGYLVFEDAKPEPIVSVIESACEYLPKDEVVPIEREWDRISFAVQGLYYIDHGVVKLSKADSSLLSKSLEANGSYALKNENGHAYWEKHVVGKKLGECSVNLSNSTLNYSFYWW